MRSHRFTWLCAAGLAIGCGDGEVTSFGDATSVNSVTADESEGGSAESETAGETDTGASQTGDGDSSGDGDGTTNGDGDGTTNGDGDGSSGDGDGSSGDGDGSSGDGDGTSGDGDGASGDGDGSSGDGDGTSGDGDGTSGDGDGTSGDGDGASGDGDGASGDGDGASGDGDGTSGDGDGASGDGDGTSGDGTSGDGDGTSGDGTTGDGDGTSGDGDGTSGDGDGSTGDGTTGDGDGATGDGTTGDGDGTSGDGTTGDGTTGDGDGTTGDGTTGDGDGSTGDGTTGDGDGTTGDGDGTTGDGDGTTGDGDGTTGDGTTGDGDGTTGDGDGDGGLNCLKVDVVFSLDSSQSLAPERAELAATATFTSIVNAIASLESGLVHYRVALVNDYTEQFIYGVPGSPAQPWFDSLDVATDTPAEMANAFNSAVGQLEVIGPNFTAGCEHNLTNMVRVLDNDTTGFLRDDALLLNVIITDTDDYLWTDNYYSVMPLGSDFLCSALGCPDVPVTEQVNYDTLVTLKNGLEFAVSSIVVAGDPNNGFNGSGGIGPCNPGGGYTAPGACCTDPGCGGLNDPAAFDAAKLDSFTGLHFQDPGTMIDNAAFVDICGALFGTDSIAALVESTLLTEIASACEGTPQ